MQTEIVPIDPNAPEPDRIKHCAKILREGGLVAFPTETVYGLAANLDNNRAVNRLAEVKKRPEGKPFSVHIARKEQIEEYAGDLKLPAYKLIDKFWPGPLTVVVEAKNGGKVGIRMPKNNIALQLILESGVHVVAPSANIAGNPPPKSVAEVLRDLGGQIDIAIDGGKAEIGIESTVVDLTVSPPAILREGVVTEGDIKTVINKKTVLFVCTGNSCRSVMAAALLKKMIAGKKDIEVLDAGIGAVTGMLPTKDALDLLSKEGIDESNHQATRLSDIMIKKADIILVMEQLHEEEILKRVPSAKDRVYLLKEFAKMTEQSAVEGINIFDPIGRPTWFYEECFNTIKEAVKRIAELI